jgi:probable DNA repair protein
MGVRLDPELAQWLEAGGLIVTASERAARALNASYHQVRRERGDTAWTTPRIEPWQQFLERQWLELAGDPRMILSLQQEQTLWATVADSESELATTLEPSRARLGKMAMEAHALLCAYSPHSLNARTRMGWQRDQATFSRWLSSFEEQCRANLLLSSARLPLELLPLLEQSTAPRSPLVLFGFDRIQPSQLQFLEAWGNWSEAAKPQPSAAMRFYGAPDLAAELAACALWCRKQLEQRPEARLLVVTQNQAVHRGQMERAFLENASPAETPLLEFSLGMVLAKTPLAQSARLLLGWLSRSIEEHALDWLLASGHSALDAQETEALQRRMRRLRRSGRQRTVWPLDAFVTERSDAPPPSAWVDRLTAARLLLNAVSTAAQSPMAWAELVPRLLEATGWPGGRALSSAEFQIHRRFMGALDACASLGCVTRRIGWSGFLALLDRILEETLYAPESTNAPILVAGPTETAGLTADAIWFLGATENGWPATGSTHPFLPLAVQVEAGMPHAHPRIDWELAETVTQRLATSTAELCFSYPRQLDGIETQPSRLVLKSAGQPASLPAELCPAPHPQPLTTVFADASRIPYPPGSAPGGAELLTHQSQCPFLAFAAARLGAKGWERAEAGLTAQQRGTLLHAVLHSVWGGTPPGIRTYSELIGIHDLPAFTRQHVDMVFEKSLPSGARQRMPRRYLDLEQQRLAALVAEWLTYEKERVGFEVEGTELEAAPSIHGLALKLRLDRIDRLNDGSLLVVDYKSGDVSPKSWNPPRPEDIQLPLYASFGLEGGALGGLVFAKVRRGEVAFDGRVGDAKATLRSDLKGTSSLIKRPFTLEMLLEWRDEIEQLAAAFVAGEATADPRDYPKTCEHCELPGLCRIREFPPSVGDEDDDPGQEAADA